MRSTRMGCEAHRNLYVRFDNGTATATDLEQFDRWVAHCPDCHEAHGLPIDHVRTWQKRLRIDVVEDIPRRNRGWRTRPNNVLKFPLFFPGPLRPS
jgi:hypothetical protein